MLGHDSMDLECQEKTMKVIVDHCSDVMFSRQPVVNHQVPMSQWMPEEGNESART